MIGHDMIGRVLPRLTFELRNVRREVGGHGRPSGVMSYGVINQLTEIWEIQTFHEGHVGSGHCDRPSRW